MQKLLLAIAKDRSLRCLDFYSALRHSLAGILYSSNVAMAQNKQRQNVMDIEKYMDKRIRVKFAGGREVVGTLKGCDGLLNIVLDDCTEYVRDPKDLSRLLEPSQTRPLGLIVCRGTNVFVVCPEDGFQSIENPFLGGDEAEEGQ